MLSEEFLNQIFKSRHENIEEHIQEEYHSRIKKINIKNEEERNNKKMSIISELYYKQGFKDGANFMLKNIK